MLYTTHKIKGLLKPLIGSEIYYAPTGATVKVDKKEIPVYFETDASDPNARKATVKQLYLDVNYNNEVTLYLECIDVETGETITTEDDCYINI